MSWWESLSGITSDEKRVASWVVGHFLSCNMVKMPDIQSASRLIIFSVFGLGRNPILNQLPDFPACFATVADRLAMRGHAGAGKLALGS